MNAIRHPDHIHCIHIYKWNEHLWCRACRNHWHATRDDANPNFEGYERDQDLVLAHAVLVAMEAGEIPISPLLAEFDLGTAFVDRMPEPSSN